VAKLIMLSGVPGCGKSTHSKMIAEKEDAIILSSDEIYVEITGDKENKEANSGIVFNEIYQRAREYLKAGKSVIIDSTNISSKRRKGVLQQFKNASEKECYHFITPFLTCVTRDKNRERTVGYGVLKGMFTKIFVPFDNEGFDKVHYVVDETYKTELNGMTKEKFEGLLQEKLSHDELFKELSQIHYFKEIFNLPQDSTYHTFSVSLHTYHVLQYINENYDGEDKLKMQYVAIFHDIGKALAKNFKSDHRYANFIGHENASAQISFGILSALGYEEEFVKDVSQLVLLHMRLPRKIKKEDVLKKIKKDVTEETFERMLETVQLINEGASEKAFEKFKEEIGDRHYGRLEFFRKADESAK